MKRLSDRNQNKTAESMKHEDDVEHTNTIISYFTKLIIVHKLVNDVLIER